ASDKFVLAQAGSRQELVDVSGNGTLFRPEIEGAFMKIEFVSNSYWCLTDRKGVRYYFGQTNDSRVFDPSNSANVFEWCRIKWKTFMGTT
ncbi:MAG TPA: SpvB/TcaC N-terminal domain-containing protein, partial [Candidatus Omnitrophota bacterium]|nr:SpvB/TcaC N-terminal domain-containing protein [Candidatus Omnitrophota bacterium]